MPNYPKRSTLPMQPSSFRAAARKLRKMVDDLDATADADTPRERAARTSVIHRLSRYAQHLSRRNRQ